MNDKADHLAPEVPYPVRVRWQIWESLVTMLRVYAHAAGLNGKEYVVTGFSDAAWVEHQGCVLGLCFDPRDGMASWRLKEPEGEVLGRFRIEQDGTLTFPGATKALDVAAIDWLEQLVRAARSPEEKRADREKRRKEPTE